MELNVFSSSESEHFFRKWYFGADNENFNPISGLDGRFGRWGSRHSSIDGHHCEVSALAEPHNAIARLYPEFRMATLESDLLPAVYAVTKFVLRRQCRRRLHPETMGHMLQIFPRLESVVFEPWRLFGHVPRLRMTWVSNTEANVNRLLSRG